MKICKDLCLKINLLFLKFHYNIFNNTNTTIFFFILKNILKKLAFYEEPTTHTKYLRKINYAFLHFFFYISRSVHKLNSILFFFVFIKRVRVLRTTYIYKKENIINFHYLAAEKISQQKNPLKFSCFSN